jgi:hypothetical protein
VSRSKINCFLKRCASMRKEHSACRIIPLQTLNCTGAIIFPLRKRARELLIQSSSTTKECISPRKILLLREIQGWSAPKQMPFLCRNEI